VLLGPALHVAADRLSHRASPAVRFEIVGSFCFAIFAARRGPFDHVGLGAAAFSGPDVEHIVP
jgi:hypothetical protein